ncbi:protrudin-like [Mizuhopecten yessoensis]|uniref:Protrudin n=1 Tax=Mizuhopecten yessoensis TaxID=6573 RepID=A0A210PX38_MIZYE|nr:protrudin-like [Mizuhopecten yessoensis]OWF41043.1 Protrudin [Mizuhopecten yessoensis]
MMEKEDQPQNGEKIGRPMIDMEGRCGKVDLVYFVAEVERFNRLIEPLAMVLYAIEDVRRWRYPNWTLGAWLVCNVLCLLLSKGAVFALVSIMVVGIATLCLVQVHTRLLDKFFPYTGRNDERTEDDEEVEETVTMKTVQYFRFSVVQMYDFIVKCNEYIAHLYGIFRWDNTLSSLKFYIELCVFLLSLVVLPNRGVWFLIVNWVFLANEEILQVIVNSGLRLYSQISGNPVKALILAEGAANTETKAESNSTPVKCVDNGQADTIGEQRGETSEAQDVDTIVEKTGVTGSGPTPGKPGMVARLREIKKKHQHLANETCFKCETSFSSILKRRYYCRHCGNNFCTKCCNQKVPKAMFGATSPTAQTETVLVCNVCYDLLTQEDKDKDKEKKS